MKKLVGFTAAVLFATTALATDNPNQEPVDVQVPVPAEVPAGEEASFCESLELEFKAIAGVPYCTAKGIVLTVPHFFHDLLRLPGAIIRWEVDGRKSTYKPGPGSDR